MSLDWDASKIADKDRVLNGASWSMTQCLIFECMAVDLYGITEKNMMEFKARSDYWRTLTHQPLIPLREIKRRIGLRTNVSQKSWASFVARHSKSWHRDRMRVIAVGDTRDDAAAAAVAKLGKADTP